MIEGRCTACQTTWRVHRLSVACRRCGRRPLKPPQHHRHTARLSQKGARLRAFRQDAWLTQAELAERVGCHRSMIDGLERGRKLSCSWPLARKIANMMRRYGHAPVEFYPGAADVSRREPSPVRRDHGRRPVKS